MGTVKYKKPSPKFVNLMNRPNEGLESRTNIRGSGIGEIFQIDSDKIKMFDKQARTRFDEKELEGLIASIQEVGIISPLLVAKAPEVGYFKVINGERRLRAAQRIGIKKVPCIILQDENKSELIAVIDNLQRSDLHPIELASAYDSLIRNYGDKKVISEKIGVPYTSFLETIKLNTLPEEIKNHLLNNNLRSRAVFRQLLKMDKLEEMRNLLGLTERNASKGKKEKIIEIFLQNNELEVEISEKKISSINMDTLCGMLQEILEKIKNKATSKKLADT